MLHRDGWIAQGFAQRLMPWRRVQQVIATQNMGNALGSIINDHCKVISPESIGPANYKIIAIGMTKSPGASLAILVFKTL